MDSKLKAAIDKANSGIPDDLRLILGKLTYSQLTEALIYAQGLQKPEIVDQLRIRKFEVAAIIGGEEPTQFMANVLKDKSFNPHVNNDFAYHQAVEFDRADVVKVLLDDEFKRTDPLVDNCFALREAARNGNAEIMRLILADKHKRADLDAKLTEALMDACKNGHVEIAEILLKDGRADPQAKGSESLRVAIERGHTAIVKLLLDDKRANPQGEIGDSLLSVAVAKNSYEIVSLLVNDPRVDPTLTGNSPYLLAIESKNSSDIAQLLLANPTVAFRVALDKGDIVKAKELLQQANPRADQHYAFYKIIKMGHADLLQDLLKNKRLDPGVNYYKALKIAVEMGKEDIVKILLQDKRADPTENECALLRNAVSMNRTDIVELFLRDGRTSPQVSNSLVLRYACANSHIHMVRLLLEDPRGYPQEAYNKSLQFAVNMGRADVVKLLLEAGRADPSANNSESLRIAAKKGHEEIVKLLLEDKRAEPQAESSEALREASANGHAGIVKLLLNDQRADPSAKASEALRMAAKKGYRMIVRDLLEDRRAAPHAVSNMAFFDALKLGHEEIAKDLLLDLRVQLTLDSFLQKNEALRLAGQKGFSEIFRLLINQSNIQMDVFIQEACNVLPQKVFPLEGVYRPHRPAQKPVFAPFRIISNNDKYIDPNVNVLGEKGKPLVHKDGKTPIGYNVHLPPAGVEIKNVIVEVYGGNQAKDRSIQAYKPGAIGTFEQHLVNEGTVVITLNLPDLLENDVFQSQISEKLHKKIHDCIDHFHKTLTTSPESLHVELAPLKDKPTFLYGASFGGLNAVHHAQKNPGTFTGYIAHNGALDMHLDRLGREYKPHLNVARKEQMDKIKDPVLLMGTEADNNVFIKMILSFYNQLNEQQKRELVRLGITPKGNLGNNVNKGHFVPDDSEELALYLQRINDFMREGPSKLPEFSDLLGYEQELLANKYANKGSLKDKFIADALMIKDQKKHTHSASIVKAWETDYKPIFNAFWVAEECTQTELYYNAEVQRLVYGNLLSDEVIFNLLKSQTELLKQFFEDKHFPLSSQLDLMPCLNNKQVFDKIRDEITKPQKPFNKSKQQYLLLALYKANPALLKTHEERLPTVKDYNDELADAQREFLQKAKQVHERRKKLWQGVVMKSSPRTAGYFEESRKIEAEKNKKAMREATVGKLQAAIDLFKFEPQVNFFDKNNVLQIELFRKAIIPKKTEGKNYLDVPTTWSEWWYGTQGGDKALLESMRYFYSECDILLKTVSKQSAELVQQFQNLELDPAKEDELRKSLTLLEKQFMGMQILKEELKAGIKDMVQDKVRFKNLDQYWSAEFVKTSEDCRNIFYENRGKMSLALERTASKKTGPAL